MIESRKNAVGGVKERAIFIMSLSAHSCWETCHRHASSGTRRNSNQDELGIWLRRMHSVRDVWGKLHRLQARPERTKKEKGVKRMKSEAATTHSIAKKTTKPPLASRRGTSASTLYSRTPVHASCHTEMETDYNTYCMSPSNLCDIIGDLNTDYWQACLIQ